MSDVFEAETTNRTGECPDCGYSLAGLPPNGRCPECGYEYDGLTRIFGRRAPINTIIAVCFLEGAAMLTLLTLWMTGLPQRVGFGSALIFGGIFVIAAGCGTFLFGLLRQQKWSIARAVTGPEQLRVQLGPGPLDRRVPWSDIEGIRVTGRYLSLGAAVRLRLDDGGSSIRKELAVEGIFQSRDELEEFVHIVNVRIGLEPADRIQAG